MTRRRIWLSQAMVRSTTRRCRPRRSDDSMPGRAMRLLILRLRRTRWLRGDRYALSACRLLGHLRGRPRLPRTGGTASMSVSSTVVSFPLAAVIITASGAPPRSVTRWRFVPGLPRSVGFGPVLAPPFLRALWTHPWQPASSRSDPRRAAGSEARGGGAPIRRPGSSRAGAASRSSPTRSPSPAEASPRECRSGAQRGCRAGSPDPVWDAGRPSGAACEVGAAARRSPTTRLVPVE